MATDRGLTAFFVRHAALHRGRYLLAFALMPLTAGLAVIGPKLLQLAVDDGIAAGKVQVLLTMTALYFAALLARIVAEIAQHVLMQSAGIRTLRDIRAALVRHLSNLQKGVFEKRPLGMFVSRATSDVETVGETLATGLINILTDALTIVAILAVLMNHNLRLGLLTLLLVPLLVLMVDWFRRRLRSLYEQVRTVNGRLSARMNEAFTMLYEVKNFHLEDHLEAEFLETNHCYRDTSIKAISYDALIYSLIDGMYYAVIGMILYAVTVPFFAAGGLTIGGVVMYLHLLAQLFSPIKQMGSRFAVLQSAYAALHKINDAMALPLAEDAGERDLMPGDLTLEHVNFSYSTDGPRVLRDVNLTIPRGRSLAIVGPTGSGKTSLIRLLTRQYEPTSGRISLNGIALPELRRVDLKHHIAVVPQEPAIFRESVAFNIGLGVPHITRARIEEVCRNVMADAFIQQLDGRYDAELESEGSNLSAGQRQLIALARAIAMDADVLIFDESTANIDTETERLIQRALDYVMQHTTTILIAHRLSTIRHVDHIVVLRSGRIDDQGSHDELVEPPRPVPDHV